MLRYSMMKARIVRNKYSILLFFIILFICWLMKTSPNRLPNYTDAMSGILSFSSLTTAIFMAALVFVPRFSIGILRRLGTDKKFLERILITTIIYFVVSVFSLLSLVLFSENDVSAQSTVFIALTFALLSSGISESLYIFWVIFKTN